MASGSKTKQQQLGVAGGGLNLKAVYPRFGVPKVAGPQVDRSSPLHKQATLIARAYEQECRLSGFFQVRRQRNEIRALRYPTNYMQLGQCSARQISKRPNEVASRDSQPDCGRTMPRKVGQHSLASARGCLTHEGYLIAARRKEPFNKET